MARFYALSIQETVFGQTCLVRRGGVSAPGAALPSTRMRQYATCSSCCAPRAARLPADAPTRHPNAAPPVDGPHRDQSRLERDQIS
ncbi:hypothetical protein B5V01_27370 [Mesorhizobium erdmanii]|uniref:Uncharacterized protein n=1 Tax=Mesorhizobium erdmanii TaxID=1777866 RepID=A0A4Q1UQ55_9HYPH|nr:hypothetical protein B5V01_27370 [Mesorhizobium erdmanii]